MRAGLDRYEELRTVGVGASVSHDKKANGQFPRRVSADNEAGHGIGGRTLLCLQNR